MPQSFASTFTGVKLATGLLALLRERPHLDQEIRAFGGDLLVRLAATDCLHGVLDLELGAGGAAIADGWESLPMGAASNGNDERLPEIPDHLRGK